MTSPNTSSAPCFLDFPISLTPVVEQDVRNALSEDLGSGDLTAQLVPAEQAVQASIVSREAGVLCGQAWFNACFLALDPEARITWTCQDGDRIAADQVLCTIVGDARALLSAERSALNFLQLLSAVASKTRHYADAIADTSAQVVDTRKTLPGLRLAQKYAVRVGGGANHRLALWDAILIKENHILAAGGIAPALQAAQAVAAASGDRCRFIQIEVENLAEFQTALNAGAQMVLLDNFSLEMMREAARLNAGQAILEASGNVTLDTLRNIALTGVNRISIGALTKDVKALDLSMRFTASENTTAAGTR